MKNLIRKLFGKTQYVVYYKQPRIRTEANKWRRGIQSESADIATSSYFRLSRYGLTVQIRVVKP